MSGSSYQVVPIGSRESGPIVTQTKNEITIRLHRTKEDKEQAGLADNWPGSEETRQPEKSIPSASALINHHTSAK